MGERDNSQGGIGERVVACCWLPRFPLRVVAHGRVDLTGPVALASDVEAHPVVLDCTEAARDHGVEPGMLVSRAMGCCGGLEVLACDGARIEHAADRFAQRLEALGAAVQLVAPGRVIFEAAPLELLYGGITGVMERVLQVFPDGEVRVGAGPHPFTAWVAARHARPGAWMRIARDDVGRVLAPMPLETLPAEPDLVRLLHALGLETLADVARIDVHQMADRFGAHGVRLHELARGVDATTLAPRVPVERVAEVLAFPEPVGNEQTLESAAQLLAERLVTHPRCVQYAPRAVIASCVLAEGGSWRARRVLRAPTVDARRLVLAIQPALAQIPASIERIELELDGFELRAASQRSLLDEGGEGAADGERVRRGTRHVQEALGDEALLQVLEVEPWSRVPERHAVLVPRRVAALESEDGR